MAYENPSPMEGSESGMGDCMACPHCGKPIYLAKEAPKEQEPETESNGETTNWENDLRGEMSPQSPQEGAM